MQTLTPTLAFEGKEYVMVTPQIAGIPVRELGPIVGEMTAERATILAAIDFLVSGN
jgi:toxin CcdB